MAANIFRAACLVSLVALGVAHSTEAATLTLAWDHSSSTGVAGYKVLYGTQSGKYTTSIQAGYVTSVSLPGLTNGTTYYFVLQSYDSSGVVGAPSSEVSGQVPVVQSLAVSCPSPIVTSLDGKAVSVTLTPTVAGGVTPITTSCSPTSGSLFPVGSTSFTCTAVDALQQKASCTSTVVVKTGTTQPPPPPPSTQPTLTPLSLTCPEIAPVTESGNSGKALVRFADPAFSGGTAPVAVSCSPRSGSTFSVGTTTVFCQATDAARQTARCTTDATVLVGGGNGGQK
ncbi:MAG: HYR domain-containing protein [Vicinamibacterales bacterium]